MRVIYINQTPIFEIEYLQWNKSGEEVPLRLPLIEGLVDEMPPSIEALLVTSDLQGRCKSEPEQQEPVLLGKVFAKKVSLLSESGKIPKKDRIGVILAGDFYSNVGRRGGTGDVRSVWNSFASEFRWVAGVAGNKDRFSSLPSIKRSNGPVTAARRLIKRILQGGKKNGDEKPEELKWHADFQEFCRQPKIHFLDGVNAEIDGLKIGGVSGKISRKQKLFYRTRKAYKHALQEVLRARPKILVLHEGPCMKEIGLPGNRFIRNLLCTEQFEDLLVICGHQHWETPLASLQSGVQILNVDSRAVLLYPKIGA
jgi:hypothetical protein